MTTDDKSVSADLSAFDAATIERARVAVREYMDWISDTGGDETGKLSPFAQDALVHQFAWYLSRRSRGGRRTTGCQNRVCGEEAMTHPTHGLDPNALEAARKWPDLAAIEAAARKVNPGRSEDHIKSVAIDALSIIRALSQNPGTSNTSGEAVGMKVKPLEWGPESGLGFHMANTPFGQYVIMTKLPPVPEVTWWFGIRHGNDKMAPSLAEAKAAAQADYEARVLAALEPRASDRERTIEECAKAGWDACRKSIYAVCEDVQTQAADPNKVSLAGTPDQKIHEKGFWLGYSDAAKSIARGFNAMEAPDDDNFAAAIRKLSEVSHE